MSRNRLTKKGISKLFDTLRESTNILSSLFLSHNILGDECILLIGEFIQNNQHLQTLHIGNRVTDNGVELLSKYAIGNVVLNELSLDDNRAITGASVQYLIDAIKKSHIMLLSVKYTSISIKKAQEISEVLQLPLTKRAVPISSLSKSAAKRLTHDS